MAKFPYYLEGISNGQRGKHFFKVLSSNSYLQIYNTECLGIQKFFTSKNKNTDNEFRHKRSDGVWEVRKSEYIEISSSQYNIVEEKILRLLKCETTKTSTYSESDIKSIFDNFEKVISSSTESFKDAQLKLLQKYSNNFLKQS